MRTLLICVCTLLGLSTACVKSGLPGKSRGTPDESTKQGDFAATGQQPKKRILFENDFRQILEDKDFKEGWALYSSAGMVDDGQIMVFSDGKKASWKNFPPNHPYQVELKPLDENRFKAFREKVKSSQSLQGYQEGVTFDAKVWHYQNFKHHGSDTEIISDFKIHAPLKGEKAQAYSELIQAFLALRSEP